MVESALWAVTHIILLLYHSELRQCLTFLHIGNVKKTRTYDALETCREEVLPQARSDANLFVVLFTDGESNDDQNAMAKTIEQATLLKQSRGMKVISIGVGVSTMLQYSTTSVH